MFTLSDAIAAAEQWGANCGPGALAGVLGLTLDAVRPHLIGFDGKRYTNPTMMRGALDSLGVRYQWTPLKGETKQLPIDGLARVQWAGPWTKAGVPMAARYRHTHWIGALAGYGVTQFAAPYPWEVFDINCMAVGGWVRFREWNDQVVPWLLREVEPAWYAWNGVTYGPFSFAFMKVSGKS